VLKAVGRVVHEDDDDGDSVTQVGELKAHIVLADALGTAGESPIDACDAQSAHLYDAALAIFQEDGILRRSVVEEFGDPTYDDLLSIDSIHILPKHRGKNLGLAVMYRALEVLGRSCGFAICEPFPLQKSKKAQGDELWARRLGLHTFTDDFGKGYEKIGRHWAKLGFRTLGKTRFLGLCLEHDRDPLEMILRRHEPARG
jgi:GNAT superfamily N-acetyltransferase